MAKQSFILLLKKSTQKMKNTDIFTDTVHLETQTVYEPDGQVQIHPCSFETEHSIVNGAISVRQYGTLVTEDDGTSRFKPFSRSGSNRYTLKHSTKYGLIRETRKHQIYQMRFPKNMKLPQVRNLMRTEMNEMLDFMEKIR